MVIPFPEPQLLKGRKWFARRTTRTTIVFLKDPLALQHLWVKDGETIAGAGGVEGFLNFWSAWEAARDVSKSLQPSSPIRWTLTTRPMQFVRCESLDRRWESLRRSRLANGAR